MRRFIIIHATRDFTPHILGVDLDNDEARETALATLAEHLKDVTCEPCQRWRTARPQAVA
jgi:hypothetical protein